MTIKELSAKSSLELSRLAVELRASLRDKRFKVATHELTKVRDLRSLRRDLARIETLLSQPSSS